MISDTDRMQALIASVRTAHPAFYRELWGSATAFENLPFASVEHFTRAPLSHRRYKDEISAVKIVDAAAGSFVSEWDVDDLAAERFGIPSARTLVHFTNAYEAVEKALWCHCNRSLSIVGEPNIAATIAAAEKFRPDSLIADTDSLQALLPYLEKRDQPLASISVIGKEFDTPMLMRFAAFARRIRLVLALPEACAIAEADLSAQPIFTLVPDCFIEYVDGEIILTKCALLVTPIIRYRTGIRAESLRDGRFTLR